MQNKFYPLEKTHEIPDDHAAAAEFKSILLLEDQTDLSEVLRSYLEDHGFRITAVQNGVEGLKKVMHGEYDIILCDMMMPNLPGDMFYRAVERTKPQLCKRFIFMTGHKGDKKIDEFIRKVRGVMLWKPFQMHDLLATIKMVLNKPA